MRSLAIGLTCLLLAGCTRTQPAKSDPVADSFGAFVADARSRAKADDDRSRRIDFLSGHSFSAGTDQVAAIGTVSFSITAEVEHRVILRVEPALSVAKYELKFAFADGKWEFKEGTLHYRLTKRHLLGGRKAEELEPDRTAPVKSLDGQETLRFLFYGKKS